MTLRFFKAIGVIGHETRRQWFCSPNTRRHTLDPQELSRVSNELSLQDVAFLRDLEQADSRLVSFFRDTGRAIMHRSQERWQQAAPYIQPYSDLASKNLPHDHRQELWDDFQETIEGAGIDITHPDYD